MHARARVVLVLALAIGGMAALVLTFQAQIATAILARIVDARVGRDALAALPDGLHVVLCGTGSPFPDATRAGPCTVVIAGQRMFVVDAGEGSARNLAQMALPAGRIEALLLTHFHSDHVDGIGPLMLMRWTGAAARAPLPVIGPRGVEQVVAGFNAAYARDAGYRTAHHGSAIAPPSGAGGQARPFDLADGAPARVILNNGGLRITAFRVDHDPVRPAFGYRFDYRGRSVVISGDTAADPRVARAARGADLLVHEALQPQLVALLTRRLDAAGQRRTAQITRDILDYHATPEQAADTARAAGVRMLVLTHIVPPVPFSFAYPAFLGDARQRFGDTIVGEDGMRFTLRPGSARIERGRMM